MNGIVVLFKDGYGSGMRVFVDFEASSLNKKSYPIEVAWVFEDGRSKSLLIRPLPKWTDWADEAQTLHRISRDQLEKEGASPAAVAQQMVDSLSGHDLYATALTWDGKWLSTLLRGGGLPQHALRLSKSDLAFKGLAREIVSETTSDAEVEALVQAVVQATVPARPPHRALADAGLELERLNLIRQAAQSLAI